MTTQELATLAEAMGFKVRIDTSAGYDVTRVLVKRDSINPDTGGTEQRECVFRPHEDAAQAFEVLCWLMARVPACGDANDECNFEIGKHAVYAMNYGHYGSDPWVMWSFEHNNTPPDLRRAIVAAAVRVAEGMK